MVLGAFGGVIAYWLYDRGVMLAQSKVFTDGDAESLGWWRTVTSMSISLGILWISIQPLSGDYEPYFAVFLGFGTAGIFSVAANGMFFWLAKRFNHRSDGIVATAAVLTFIGFMYSNRDILPLFDSGA